MSNDKMRLYEALREVPASATSEIVSGPLGGKGFSAISPMWRIRRMTEVFGPCGFGWWYRVTDKRIEQGGNTAKAFVDIELFVKDPSTGEISQPIFGTGGSTFFNREGISDEAIKMALTDAIGVACKNLGLAADIYEEKDRLKNDPSGDMKFGRLTKEEAPKKEEVKKSSKEVSDLSLEEAYQVVIPFGPEKGKTMKEAKENTRFWNFLASMDPRGDKEKEKCKAAYRVIEEKEKAA